MKGAAANAAQIYRKIEVEEVAEDIIKIEWSGIEDREETKYYL